MPKRVTKKPFTEEEKKHIQKMRKEEEEKEKKEYLEKVLVNVNNGFYY